MKIKGIVFFSLCISFFIFPRMPLTSRTLKEDPVLDEKVRKFLSENFRKTGLDGYIDARLADAHVLVKELEGPFDFVFSDADKEWYKNYFIDIDPKLIAGGCFTAHNVYDREKRYGGSGAYGGPAEFLRYVRSLDNYETTVNSSGGAVSTSYKKSEK